MSQPTNSRSTLPHDRAQSASFPRRGTNPRAGAKERPLSSEVAPDDSASNASFRRVPSGGSKVNGSLRNYSERQNTKVTTTSRDHVSIRTRSPVKTSYDGADAQRPRKPSRSESKSSPFSAPVARKAKQPESKHTLYRLPSKILTCLQ